MKLYTFTDEAGRIIEEVRAEDYESAMEAATHPYVNRNAEFYSETLDDEWDGQECAGYSHACGYID